MLAFIALIAFQLSIHLFLIALCKAKKVPYGDLSNTKVYLMRVQNQWKGGRRDGMGRGGGVGKEVVDH